MSIKYLSNRIKKIEEIQSTKRKKILILEAMSLEHLKELEDKYSDDDSVEFILYICIPEPKTVESSSE